MGRVIFTRTTLETTSSTSGIFFDQIQQRQKVINYKALLRRSANLYAVKVGFFDTQSRIGQAAEAVGTAVIPGDISPIRSPGRSTVYSAITPGGILPSLRGGRLPSRTERGYRCPEGFQYGGRFTDSRFSTCGQMLFDIFGIGTAIGQLIKPIGAAGIRAGVGGSVSPIPGLSPQEQQIIISRAAQIPRIGPADVAKKTQAIEQAMDALKGAEDGVSLMVRRDGFGLRPVVPTSILRTVPDNRNMEGATFLTAVSKADSVGKDELGLLSNTGITDLTYIAPNGVSFGLRKTRPLTVGERRKLGRTVAQAAKSDTATDPTARLKMVAQELNGAIQYSESLGSIDKPNDIVTVSIGGQKRQMRRWAYDTFIKGSKRPKQQVLEPDNAIETNDSELNKQITSLAAAIRYLESGGDPSRILPSLLPAALQKTRGYSSKRVDKYTKVHLRPGVHSITEVASENDFEHLNARVSSDIQKLVGLDSPRVLLGGQGTRAPYFSIAENRRNIAVSTAENLDNAPPSAVLSLAVSDYLLDHRDRTPNTTQIVNIDGRIYIRSANNKLTLLAGIPKAQQSARQRLGVDEVINAERAQFYARAFRKLSDEQRRQVIRQLDSILQRLSQFSLEEYMTRLSVDGNLSSAEKNHLKIVKSIIETRLSTLKSSKQTFVNLITQAV